MTRADPSLFPEENISGSLKEPQAPCRLFVFFVFLHRSHNSEFHKINKMPPTFSLAPGITSSDSSGFIIFGISINLELIPWHRSGRFVFEYTHILFCTHNPHCTQEQSQHLDKSLKNMETIKGLLSPSSQYMSRICTTQP